MPDEPLSILVLHPTFEEWGGAEWFIHGMLERFVAGRGARVRLLTHRWETPWGEAPSYQVVEHGRGGYHTRPEDWDRIARDVLDAARGCDVVWIHNHPATEWYARAGGASTLPFAHWYCHEPAALLWGASAAPSSASRDTGGVGAAIARLARHGTRAPERLARALRDRIKPEPEAGELRASDRAAVASVASVQANSRYTATRVEEVFGREARVVYPIAEDLSALAPASGERRPLVLWLGRLAEPKRPLLMLDAWRLARARSEALRSWELLLVGDGPLRPQVAEWLEREGANSGASLRAGLARRELVELLQSALVTVHLGLAEPLGLVPIEAMACGSAVLAHAEGGALETVAHGETGWCVPLSTPEHLAHWLARLPEERDALAAMGRAGVRRVARLFSAERCEQELWAVLSGAPDAPAVGERKAQPPPSASS